MRKPLTTSINNNSAYILIPNRILEGNIFRSLSTDAKKLCGLAIKSGQFLQNVQVDNLGNIHIVLGNEMIKEHSDYDVKKLALDAIKYLEEQTNE